MLRGFSFGGVALLVSGCWHASPSAPAAPSNRVVVSQAAPVGRELVTHVVDAETSEPVRGAMVIVLRQDVTPSDIDILRWQGVADGHGALVDELVVASGRCNGAGKVTLPAPPQGSYEVVVLGREYEPLHAPTALRISEDQLPLDPFGQIRLVKKTKQ
jgi:hypothetical protein